MRFTLQQTVGTLRGLSKEGSYHLHKYVALIVFFFFVRMPSTVASDFSDFQKRKCSLAESEHVMYRRVAVPRFI